uniref:Uncharacterized protein n=1 Tax=Rheinheimera sp. BAL341 TaxID=1708203 RepID=A0A486XV09_9GAMM
MLLQPLYAASAATTLSLYTEHMPPYSYQQGDKVEGINAELMRAYFGMIRPAISA